MVAEDELPRFVRRVADKHADESRLRRVAGAPLFGPQDGLEVVLLPGAGEFPPIFLFKRGLHLLVDQLKWFVEKLPDESSAQFRVGGQHLLPRLFKNRDVETAMQEAIALLQPSSGRAGVGAVQEKFF